MEKDSDKKLSLGDFFKLKPWDLRDKADPSIRFMFKFLPQSFTEGPWKASATWTMIFIACLVLYLTIDANIKFYSSNSENAIMKEFVGDKSYPAFTSAWYYNATMFFWMMFVSWAIRSKYTSFGPWITFTLWSWTIMTLRHFLCALAPFLPSLRLFIGILRFPVLLSASVTFGVWNFVLMPVLTMGLLKGERRSKFLQFAFKWTMSQIHLLNILFAYLNCVWAEPSKQGLHLGDVNAAVVYIMTYILFYYFILDRIGVQLYPIFSPRTYLCIPSWIMTGGICIGNYVFWNKILSATE